LLHEIGLREPFIDKPRGARAFATPWSTAVAGVQDNAISRLPERTHVRQRWRGAREGEVMATFTRSDDLQGAEFADGRAADQRPASPRSCILKMW
jgi:hypothetical protein